MVSKLIIIVILASISCNVSAMRCYFCQGCNDPFTPDSKLEFNCDGGNFPIFGKAFEKLDAESLSKTNSRAIGSACLKLKAEDGTVARSCTSSVDGLDVCEVFQSAYPDQSIDCEVCEEDLCNSNVMYTGNILLIAILMYSVFLFL